MCHDIVAKALPNLKFMCLILNIDGSYSKVNVKGDNIEFVKKESHHHHAHNQI